MQHGLVPFEFEKRRRLSCSLNLDLCYVDMVLYAGCPEADKEVQNEVERHYGSGALQVWNNCWALPPQLSKPVDSQPPAAAPSAPTATGIAPGKPAYCGTCRLHVEGSNAVKPVLAF